MINFSLKTSLKLNKMRFLNFNTHGIMFGYRRPNILIQFQNYEKDFYTNDFLVYSIFKCANR